MHAPTLRYLIKVAEFGSIRRAAEVLNVASSGCNRQIPNVERSLGVTLFERTARGVGRRPPADEVQSVAVMAIQITKIGSFYERSTLP